MNKILIIRNLCSILRANLPLTSILITGFLAILSLISCSEDSEPESNIFNVQYSVDSIGQVTTQQVTLIFNDLTFKTILKKITLPFIFMIKPYRIRRQNPMNIKTQATGFYDKMNVIIHQTKTVHFEKFTSL